MNPTQDTYRHRILKVQLHIQEHLDEDLSLERLARIAHFSPFHFHRIFSALVGESVHDHVRRLRLESAAILLKTSDRPVTQIAFDTGYDTHESFSRAFRQMFGVSPSQFRAGQRPVPSTVSTGLQGEEISMSTSTTADVHVRNVEPMRVAFVRHVGPYENVVLALQRFLHWAGQRGLFGPDTKVIGIGHDDPHITPADKLRFDCCVTVSKEFQPEGEVGVQTVGGGEFAVLTHRGPYEKLGDCYRLLYGTWLPASGREPRHEPPFEVYHNSPGNTQPEDLLTEIYVPLEPR